MGIYAERANPRQYSAIAVPISGLQVLGTLNGSRTDPSAWDKFKTKLCSAVIDEYHVLLPFKIRAINVPGQQKEVARERIFDEIRRMGLETIESADVLSRYSFLQEKDVEKNQIYLLESVSAYDVFSASHLAIVKAKLRAAYSYANMGKVSYAQTENECSKCYRYQGFHAIIAAGFFGIFFIDNDTLLLHDIMCSSQE